jgi:hypothetical protein
MITRKSVSIQIRRQASRQLSKSIQQEENADRQVDNSLKIIVIYAII